MTFNRFERRLAAALDSAPRLRALLRSAYRRANYLVTGGRGQDVRLHAQAALERIAGGRDPGSEECFHGYFGLQPWDRTGRRYLFHRWSPRARDVEICVREPSPGSVTVVGRSSAWNFQQGSLAHWLPAGDAESIVFNDVVDRRLVCRILSPGAPERRIDWPVQALHPGGEEALSLNYRRLARLRAEYGYAPDVDNFDPDAPLDADGLWRVDLRMGTATLVVPLAALASRSPRPEMEGALHKLNHAVYSPLGSRIAFLHRWLGPRGKFSRLYASDPDGRTLRLLLDHRVVSHYAWRDERTLLVWGRTPDDGDCYSLIDVETGSLAALASPALRAFGDGHPSYSPDRRWIVTDTYPNRARLQRLLLVRSSDLALVEVGTFRAPWAYDGPVRCDLHPRWSQDGLRLSIDSAHEGRRATYAVDVSHIVSAG